MLQWIRDKLQGFIVWFIIGIITLVFILGASSYLFNHGSYSKVLAKVNGEAIGIDEVNDIYHNHVKQHYSKQKNYNNFDLDPKKIKNQILTGLVNQKAVIQGINSSRFTITDEQLVKFVKNESHFQDNGKFSSEKYNNFLKQISLTELQYQELLRNHLLMEQLRNTIILSNCTQLPEVENFIVKWHQTRNFGYVVIPFKKFIQQTISDQSIEDYYNNNKKSFVKPETVSINYLDITANKLMNKIQPNKDKLYNYYQEHTEYYTLPELINIRHILIAAPKTIPKEKNDKSRLKVEEILAKLKLGQDFTKLAKEYSDDSSSSKNGGGLGWLGRGEVDIDVEQAAFNLETAGEISGVVQSKFGYHIIQLIEKRKAKINNFEKVMNQVQKHYQEEEVQAKLQEISDELSNPLVANEDLTKIANKFNLEIQSAGPFTSSGTTTGIASYSSVVMAAFDSKNLNKNSDLIKLAEDHFVILKVTDKQIAREKTLLESHDEIKEMLQSIAAKQQTKEYGLDLAKKLLASDSPNKLTKTYDVDWNTMTVKRDDKNINSEILKAAFSLPKAKMQKTLSLANGDFVIVQLLNINDGDLKKMLSEQPDLKEQMKEQLVQLQAYLEQKLYEQVLFNTAKIKFTNNIDQL